MTEGEYLIDIFHTKLILFFVFFLSAKLKYHHAYLTLAFVCITTNLTPGLIFSVFTCNHTQFADRNKRKENESIFVTIIVVNLLDY